MKTLGRPGVDSDGEDNIKADLTVKECNSAELIIMGQDGIQC